MAEKLPAIIDNRGDNIVVNALRRLLLNLRRVHAVQWRLDPPFNDSEWRSNPVTDDNRWESGMPLANLVPYLAGHS